MRLTAKVFLTIILLSVALGICTVAHAKVETVQITVNLIDDYTGKPVPHSIAFQHSQCMYWGNHEAIGEECSCFESELYPAHNWGLVGLEPCKCGERWDDFTQHTPWDPLSSSGTFTLKTGHTYLLTLIYNPFGYGEYYIRPRPAAYIYADPETGMVTFEKNGVNLIKTAENTFQMKLTNRGAPVEVNINATKLMDGADPGDLKFAFKVWNLTDEQMDEVFDIQEAFDKELFSCVDPEIFSQYETWEEFAEANNYETYEDFVNDVMTPQAYENLCKLVQSRLAKYQYTVVYNEGKNVPILNKTFSAYNTGEDLYEKFNYVISEVEQKGNSICEDPAVYAICGEVYGGYQSMPSNLDEEVRPAPRFIFFDTPTPMTYNIRSIIGISPSTGMLGKTQEEEEMEDVDTSQLFIFNNTTCPYADRPDYPAAEVPATGDKSCVGLWMALMLLAGGAMLMLMRRHA